MQLQLQAMEAGLLWRPSLIAMIHFFHGKSVMIIAVHFRYCALHPCAGCHYRHTQACFAAVLAVLV